MLLKAPGTPQPLPSNSLGILHQFAWLVHSKTQTTNTEESVSYLAVQSTHALPHKVHRKSYIKRIPHPIPRGETVSFLTHKALASCLAAGTWQKLEVTKWTSKWCLQPNHAGTGVSPLQLSPTTHPGSPGDHLPPSVQVVHDQALDETFPQCPSFQHRVKHTAGKLKLILHWFLMPTIECFEVDISQQHTQGMYLKHILTVTKLNPLTYIF